MWNRDQLPADSGEAFLDGVLVHARGDHVLVRDHHNGVPDQVLVAWLGYRRRDSNKRNDYLVVVLCSHRVCHAGELTATILNVGGDAFGPTADDMTKAFTKKVERIRPLGITKTLMDNGTNPGFPYALTTPDGNLIVAVRGREPCSIEG